MDFKWGHFDAPEVYETSFLLLLENTFAITQHREKFIPGSHVNNDGHKVKRALQCSNKYHDKSHGEH